MPANTARGYPYPLPADPVSAGADAIKNLAAAIDARLRGPRLVGKATVVIPNGQASGSLVITFPAGLFTAAPAVLVTVNTTTTTVLANSSGPTTSATNLMAFTRAGTPVGATTNVPVGYVAEQQ